MRAWWIRVALGGICVTACLGACSARADGQAAQQWRTDVGSDVSAMLECRIWAQSLGGCLTLAESARDDIDPRLQDPYARNGPDYPGARRDTYYFLGLQVSIIGLLYVMPESVSGWSDEQKNQHRLNKWWNNVTHWEWDKDDHYINYVLHPYWGAAYYVRARERGFSPRGAFWYSYLLSSLYEMGLEAMFEPVSIQDFFVTPIVGSWLGGYFMDWREGAKARIADTDDPRFRDRALLVATDPLGNVADLIDRRVFGRSVEFQAAPFVTTLPSWSWEGIGPSPELKRETAYGVTLSLRW